MRHRILSLSPVLLFVSFLLALSASAHHLPPGFEEIDEFSDGASFLAGANHPLTGWDHLLAAFLTGVVTARLNRTGRVMLPLTAVVAMIAGTMMPRLPMAESLLAASVFCAAGIALVRSSRVLSAGTTLLALFQMWHGNTHAVETPLNAARGPFLAGTAGATLVLMVLGLAVTLLMQRWMPGRGEAAQPA